MGAESRWIIGQTVVNEIAVLPICRWGEHQLPVAQERTAAKACCGWGCGEIAADVGGGWIRSTAVGKRFRDAGRIIDTVDRDRDVLAGAAVGQAVVIAQVDAVGGGDRFTSSQVLAQVVVEVEGPVDGAGVGAREAAHPGTREGEGVGQILQGRVQIARDACAAGGTGTYKGAADD